MQVTLLASIAAPAAAPASAPRIVPIVFESPGAMMLPSTPPAMPPTISPIPSDRRCRDLQGDENVLVEPSQGLIELSGDGGRRASAVWAHPV